MNVREMHIGIDLGLQRISSHVTKNFLPQELDWFLNNEVTKFLKQRQSPTSNIKRQGFQETSKRIEDLKDLVKSAIRPIRINNEEEEFITFPPNYFDYIRFDSILAKNCDNVSIETEEITYNKVKFDTLLGNLNVNILDNYRVVLNRVGEDPVILFSLADIPTEYLGSSGYYAQGFMLTKALTILLPLKLKEAFPNNYVELYKEFEGIEYNKNTFTLYTDIEVESITVLINTTPTDYISTVSTNTNYVRKALTLNGHIRVIDEEFRGQAERSSLSRSNPNSLTSSIRQHTLNISSPPSVVLGYVKMTYICKPTLIDLHLNSSLNMSRKICEEIVDNTVRFMKGLIDDRNYENYIKENMLIE